LNFGRKWLESFVSTALLLTLCLYSCLSCAERRPVLDQIDLPHPYYYREMYLPQLTSGPSSLSWSPDGAELIYSMAGSLWRQRLDSAVAVQLTDGEGYDYQPDWSPDGRFVIYSSYRASAVELRVLDLSSGETRALTNQGAVSVEPRFASDGRRVVFVSTSYHRRFHVFTADFSAAGLGNVRRLTGEHRSELPRYYYSAFDHEISPVFTRDGREILYVSNRGHIQGTGGFWRMSAAPGPAERADADAAVGDGAAREFHYEETNWKAHPDVSPDGSRIVFSSYLGRAWHNLWVMPAGGGDAFPIAYGDWDQTAPRWSPDGRQIAFVSNRSGNTEIDIEQIPGGEIRPLPAPERHYRAPTTRLHLTVRDGAGQPASARFSVTDSAGRFHAPSDAWIQGDDGYDRQERSTEAHYFHVSGESWLDVPVGSVVVEVLHGLERRPERRVLDTEAGRDAAVTVDLSVGELAVPADGAWSSGDVHVHMNYGGAYRNTPAHLSAQAEAEGLSFVNALIVNKEQRIPDMPFSGLRTDPNSRADALVVHGQEFHTSYWGHLGLLDLPGGVILPGYAGYPGTAAASLYPMNADVADIAHARGALVGYVHPFDEHPEPLAQPAQPLTNELPVDVALGKVDYMEILGFADYRATAAVWYQLLNLGFRIPAAGGTDAMANFASLRGPVGMDRVYVRSPPAATGSVATSGSAAESGPAAAAHARPAAARDSAAASGSVPPPGGPLEIGPWLAGLKAGRSFATNGPLLGFELGGAALGDELDFAAARSGVPFTVRLASIVAVDHLDLVCNARVLRSFLRHPSSRAEFRGLIPLTASGWCLLRASTDGARAPILDNYVYATTSPIYVSIGGRPARSPADARYFAAWIDRIAQATAEYPDWNSAAEQNLVLERLAQARAVFVGLAGP
jgi:hypothetical protein